MFAALCLVGKAILVSNRTLEQSSTLGLTPHQGFMLSRIDGKCDLRTILKISPIPEIEALGVVWSLLQADLIQVKA